MTIAMLLLRLEGKSRAAAALGAAPDGARAGAAAAAVAKAFDAAWSRLRAGEERAGALACRAGCSACCHQPVAVLPVEAVAIARTLLAAGDRAVPRRLPAAGPAADGPTSSHRARAACAFLGAAGECTIHAIRPLRCRGLHSRDATACASGPAAAAPTDRDVFPLLPIRLADAALAGLAEACAGRGVPVTTVELVAAVALLLASPDRIAAVTSGGDDLDEARLDEACLDGAAPTVAKG